MKKYCAIRFDDVCPTMEKEQFDKAFSLMDQFDIKPLIGVIPNNNDPEQVLSDSRKDYWEYIISLQKKGYCIAMHGLTHVYDQESPKTIMYGKKHSEFAGHSYAVQFERIKEGKEILNSHGVYTDVFFAPAHSYDANTLKALSANGFKFLSDGLSKKPYMQCGIKCIPCRTFKRVGSNGIYVYVAHPSEWVRKGKTGRFEELKDFCTNNINEILSFEELKKIKCGFFFFQKISEKVFFFKNRLRRIIARIIK